MTNQNLNEQMIKLEKMKTIKVEIEILGTDETKRALNKCLAESLYADFLEKGEKITGIKIVEGKDNYKEGFNILLEYLDSSSIDNKERAKINRKLTRCGL